MVNSSVAAVLALAIYGCSTADTTTIEVEHSVSVPTRPTTETSDVESATTAVPAEVGAPDEALTPEGWLRILPSMWAEKGGLDGFFIARLDRIA